MGGDEVELMGGEVDAVGETICEKVRDGFCLRPNVEIGKWNEILYFGRDSGRDSWLWGYENGGRTISEYRLTLCEV